jgi:hypothetical protein
MTATAIMVIIIVFTLSIATGTVRIYDNAINSLRTSSESRTVINALSQDLQSAIVKGDTRVWIQIEHEEDVGNIPRANAPQIMLFAPVPERIKRETATVERIPGAVCAIKYQIGHRSPFDNPGDPIQQIYGLYRAVVDAQGTFEGPLKSLINSTKEPREIWRSENASVLDASGNRTSQSLFRWSTEPQNFHASNIVSLSLLFYYQETDTAGNKKSKILAHSDILSSVKDNLAAAQIENIEVVPYMSSIRIIAGGILIDGEKSEGHLTRTLRSIDIAITVLDPDGDTELRGRQKTLRSPKINPEVYNKLIRQHGYTFTASIPITQQ